MSRRTERLGEAIRAELARLLHEEAVDPRIGLVTLTRVDVAPDLSNARVYWSRLTAEAAPSSEQDERVRQGLESAAGFLRRRLAQQLAVKRVPALRFQHDPSLELGAGTLALLRELGDAGPD